jgi:subtilisin family serine protease
MRKTYCTRRRWSNLFSTIFIASALSLVYSCREQTEGPLSASELNSTAETKVKGSIGINVLLKAPITAAAIKELNKYGNVLDQIPKIKALTMRSTSANLPAIRKLSLVDTANPDAERAAVPTDPIPVGDFSSGLSTWNLDAINVTNFEQGRVIQQDASGVFIGVLDTGLPDSWRQYFPQERIATQYAKSFGGGGGTNGNVSEQPNKWEHDQNSHGVHVTSTILGFNLGGTYFNGVAPKATIVPVKVLNQNGSGWSSVIARGIVYMAELKEGPLKNSPVVINMSLGGGVLDAVEKAAIDYAISKGVIIVASAGNNGLAGMGYPGAYQPVISVANAGWVQQWATSAWWYALNVPDPTNPADFYIETSSSRQLSGQDLDVTAPGTNIVGPYEVNSGHLSYYYLTGTSMSSPHVAGIVALMAQKRPSLFAAQAETILQNAAIPMGAGSRVVPEGDGTTATYTWEGNATGSGFITADAAVNATP